MSGEMAPGGPYPENRSSRSTVARPTLGIGVPLVLLAAALLLQMTPDLMQGLPRPLMWTLSVIGALGTATMTLLMDPQMRAVQRARFPTAARGAPPLVELPPYSRHFTGHEVLMAHMRRRFARFPRSGLRRLLDRPSWLSDRRSRLSPLVMVVTGPPGTGKSQLVTQIAHEVADRFPDGVRWVSLSGDRGLDSDLEAEDPSQPRNARERFREFAQRLIDRATTTRGQLRVALPRRAPRRPEKVLEVLLESLQGAPRTGAPLRELSAAWRSLTHHKRLLVVLDNAKDAGQVEPLLPSGARCAVLVTARRAFGDATFEYEPCELDGLPQEKGEELLDKLAPAGRRGTLEQREADRERRSDIVRRCCGLPLAIRLCGGRLAELADPSPEDLLRELDKLDNAPLLHGPNGFASSFAFSLQLCQRRERLLLKRVADADLEKFSDWTAAALLGVPRETAQDLIDELRRRFLVLPGEYTVGGEQTYRLHDLVRDTLRLLDPRDFGLPALECVGWQEPAARAAIGRLLSAYTWFLEGARAQVTPAYERYDQVPFPEITPPTALRLAMPGRPRQWLAQERESLMTCFLLAEEYRFPELGWRLTQAFAALCQTWRLFFEDWEVATRVEFHMAIALGDRRASGMALLDRAESLRAQGDYQRGIEFAQTAQLVFDEPATPDPRWQARAWRALGVNLQRGGDLDGAQEALENAERMFTDVGLLWWRARAMCELAEVYAQQGRLRRAQALLRLACVIFRTEGDWEQFNRARITLAEVLAARGRQLNAWYMLTEVRQCFERGGEWWYAARCLRGMGELDSDVLDAQYEQCDLAFNPARAESRISRFGRRKRPSIAEHQRPARLLLGEYYEVREEEFGTPPTQRRVGLRRAAAARSAWSPQQRIELLEQAIELLQNMGDVWGTHRTRLALGRAQLRAGYGPDAVMGTMRNAAEGMRELGDDLWHARAHWMTAHALYRAGHARYAQDDAQLACEHYQRLPTTSNRIAAQELLGEILYETGNTQEAVHPLRDALRQAERQGVNPRRLKAYGLLRQIFRQGRGNWPSLAKPEATDTAVTDGDDVIGEPGTRV
ncbi:hypothetical protein CDO52_22280 [Nocardiopsis gilva YIM 90087]|uniref:AAA+ ATPase domain-containing protein n=1 Tax=Nocardiopsis gilva YIM 90087 TaxID=1235441 RepID=A0A223SAJ5_9ACTN|nr:tetratricopeptide repeat protein [Nocardiopsis gilva]ASU85154.1 hypothetical protein CDO52_22280 [Nocardiopsis gilva YIM 90087]